MTAPLDLAAVEADDALLDMLGSSVVVTDDDLSRVLYAWRQDVDAEAIGVLVDTDKAVRLVRAARKPFVGRVVGAFLRLLGVQR